MNIRNWSSCKLESKGIKLVNLYIEIDPRNEILASNWGKKYDAKFGLGILPLLSLMIKYHKTTFSVTVQKKKLILTQLQGCPIWMGSQILKKILY